MSLEKLKQVVSGLHAELPANDLVRWTGGNVSGRDPDTGYVVIKPSGVSYTLLRPENMAVVDLEGNQIDGPKPSTDTLSHLVIYRAKPEINGIVHTHSPHATAFAALGQDIPCVLTAIADEFGGPIPCGRYARIGGEEIGKAILEVLETGTRSPAVLLRSHGVFTFGANPAVAVKAAVMVEDVARTVFLASLLSRMLGDLTPLPQAEIDALHAQYTGAYGQREPVR